MVWDGENKHEVLLNSNLPYIWSSVTLYNSLARTYRRELFQQWISRNVPVSSVSLFDFFISFTDSENGFLMNRNEQTKTLNYTFIELRKDDSADMQYHDILCDTYYDRKIWFNKSLENLHFSMGILPER